MTKKQKLKKKTEVGQESFHASTVTVDSPDYTGLDHVDVLQVAEPANCLRCTGLLNITSKDANLIQHTWGTALLDHNTMLCHYSKGNKQCPGASVRIIRYADLDKAVEAYIDALDRGDMKRLTHVTNAINEKDESTAALVMVKVNERLKERQNIPLIEVSEDEADTQSETTEIVEKTDEPTPTP